MNATITVRVRVHDAWEDVVLALPPATAVGELKREALRRAHRTGDPAGFEVKFRGALILDEESSLEGAGVVPNAALIILPRRRQAVR